MNSEEILIAVVLLSAIPLLLYVMGKDAIRDLVHDFKTAPRWYRQALQKVIVRVRVPKVYDVHERHQQAVAAIATMGERTR
jgi:hypothetical protein